jgi:hypothetical protein
MDFWWNQYADPPPGSRQQWLETVQEQLGNKTAVLVAARLLMVDHQISVLLIFCKHSKRGCVCEVQKDVKGDSV